MEKPAHPSLEVEGKVLIEICIKYFEAEANQDPNPNSARLALEALRLYQHETKSMEESLQRLLEGQRRVRKK